MNRIGQEEIERIFKISVDLEGKDSKQDKLCIDTTVQEKITDSEEMPVTSAISQLFT
jgi:hypothetical protein